MTNADRWILPEGIEELLPEQAEQVEALRRQLLDLFHSWGYQLVVPPLLEFTESLLVGLGSDVNLQTFKVTDQLTGRSMGIRADITPQTARIDAHSLAGEGPRRLCYAGSVLHTRPKNILASRSPIQLGAELYGDSSIAADIEVICLMLEMLRQAGVEQLTLDLGHVGIYRALIADAGLDADAEQALFDALQRKAGAEIAALSNSIGQADCSQRLLALAQLNGGIDVLDRARQALQGADSSVFTALDRLQAVADCIAQRMPDVNLYFDLGELRGFHYHTGLVFSALAPGYGQALANGGRYDDIGEVFGRARPATGFNTDLKALLSVLPAANSDNRDRIFAPDDDCDLALWQAIQQLRRDGAVVITGNEQQRQESNCQQQLVLQQGQWQLQPLAANQDK